MYRIKYENKYVDYIKVYKVPLKDSNFEVKKSQNSKKVAEDKKESFKSKVVKRLIVIKVLKEENLKQIFKIR